MSQWYVQAVSGEQFGPIDRAELDQWVAQRRLTARCQVWMDGWPEWKMATEEFPQIVGGVAAPGPMSDSQPGSAPPPPPPAYQQPAQQSGGSPYQAPAYGAAPVARPGAPSDTAGVTSVTLGIIALSLVFLGCVFTCIGGFLVYPISAVLAAVGLVFAFNGQGNNRAVGITLNLVALIPAILLFLATMLSAA